VSFSSNSLSIKTSIATLIPSTFPFHLQIHFSTETFLFGLRQSGGSMGNRWEIPGGKVEEGESFEDAIDRELQEEFCVSRVASYYLTEAGFIHNQQSFLVKAFLVQVSGLPKVHPEHQEIGFFTLQSALELDLVDSDRKLILSLI